MAGSRIPSALIVSGMVLLLLYTAGWVALLWHGREPDAAEASGSATQEATGTELDYRVTDSEGNEHLMRARSSDPGALLLEVTERYGQGASVRRLEPREAAQARQQEQRLRVSSHLWVGVLLVLPLSLIWAGVRLRRREQELVQVWNALRPTLSLPLATLLQRTGQSDAALKENLIRLSRRGWAELQYHPESGRVFDARLSAYSLTLTFCPQCNEPTNARMLADLNQVPTCPACMNVYDRSFLEAQKKDLVTQLVNESARRAAEQPVDGDFSVARYALFAVLFPPAALSYALTKAS